MIYDHSIFLYMYMYIYIYLHLYSIWRWDPFRFTQASPNTRGILPSKRTPSISTKNTSGRRVNSDAWLSERTTRGAAWNWEREWMKKLWEYLAIVGQ